ncbi:jerky protein homolog-like [Bactrocera tryoni]|uniref:jerky protein homolog-like n=1 Tax=Bactrocera tryoni TaxID=59916 RepID=UPI001A95AF33|nr:jerky protein homolog-like [Bactrocera tryoni]
MAEQYEKLCDMMATKRDIAQGFQKRPKEEVQEFWEEVARNLNAFGPPTKDSNTWRKVWIDWKYYMKRKLSHNKKERMSTGGGPCRLQRISPLDEKVIALTGLETDDIPSTKTKKFNEAAFGKMEEVTSYLRHMNRSLETLAETAVKQPEEQKRHNRIKEELVKEKVEIKMQMLRLGPNYKPDSKKIFGIRHLKICGEILSSDKSGITSFIHNLRAKMNEMEISDMQLYNADESGLFYRFLPDKTFVAANEKTAPGRKIAKDRITFMLCANANGSHKLKPLIIGKSANPRCFKGFENPLEYANSQKSWKNSELFFRWFHHSFIKQVGQFSAENNLPPRALLLIDNCTAHKPTDKLQSDDRNIAAMLLPPNVTAVFQPMDQNPIRLVKLEYRAKLLWNIVAQENIPVENILKGHSIRDTILLLKLAWDE